MLQKFLQAVSTLFLSLVLATLVWFVAVREENPPVEADYDRSIQLEVDNVPAGTVIFDTGSIPASVSLRLRAGQSNWEQLSPSKFRAWIDLADLTPGLHDVLVQVEVSDQAVTVVNASPTTVNVRLEKLEELDVPIKVNVMDNAPVGYVARTPVMSPITATVSGPATAVTQVTQATADVYLRNAKDTVKRSVELTPRDANGDIVNRVALAPSKIEVNVPIEQRFGYRDVSVRVSVAGEVAAGYWISNITVEPSTVTVVGGPSALQQLPGYIETFTVDVSGATSDVTERVAFQLPPGVSVVQADATNGESSGAQVQIQVAAVESGQTVDRLVTVQGLDQNRVAEAKPERVDVILSGPLPRLQALTLDDVRVILDLYGLGVGVHKVKPTVVVPETLRVESVLPDTIEVEISIAPPTPTATLVPTATLSRPITTTVGISVTMTPGAAATAKP